MIVPPNANGHTRRALTNARLKILSYGYINIHTNTRTHKSQYNCKLLCAEIITAPKTNGHTKSSQQTYACSVSFTRC